MQVFEKEGRDRETNSEICQDSLRDGKGRGRRVVGRVQFPTRCSKNKNPMKAEICVCYSPLNLPSVWWYMCPLEAEKEREATERGDKICHKQSIHPSVLSYET